MESVRSSSRATAGACYSRWSLGRTRKYVVRSPTRKAQRVATRALLTLLRKRDHILQSSIRQAVDEAIPAASRLFADSRCAVLRAPSVHRDKDQAAAISIDNRGSSSIRRAGPTARLTRDAATSVPLIREGDPRAARHRTPSSTMSRAGDANLCDAASHDRPTRRALRARSPTIA